MNDLTQSSLTTLTTDDIRVRLKNFKPTLTKPQKENQTPRQTYRCIVLGPESSGKTSLTNLLFSTWLGISTQTEEAFLPSAGSLLNGPRRFLNKDGRPLLDIWEGTLDFNGISDEEKKHRMVMVAHIVQGHFPNLFNARGNKTDTLDLVLIVAKSEKDMEHSVELWLTLRKFLIPAVIVATHSTSSYNPLLEGTEYFCIDSPQPYKKITDECKKIATNILANIFLEIEKSRNRKEPMQQQCAEPNRGYLNWSLMTGLLVAASVFF